MGCPVSPDPGCQTSGSVQLEIGGSRPLAEVRRLCFGPRRRLGLHVPLSNDEYHRHRSQESEAAKERTPEPGANDHAASAEEDTRREYDNTFPMGGS
jgi:hypothetical protein